MTVRIGNTFDTVIIRALDAYTACRQAEELSDSLFAALPRAGMRAG